MLNRTIKAVLSGLGILLFVASCGNPRSDLAGTWNSQCKADGDQSKTTMLVVKDDTYRREVTNFDDSVCSTKLDSSLETGTLSVVTTPKENIVNQVVLDPKKELGLTFHNDDLVEERNVTLTEQKGASLIEMTDSQAALKAAVEANRATNSAPAEKKNLRNATLADRKATAKREVLNSIANWSKNDLKVLSVPQLKATGIATEPIRRSLPYTMEGKTLVLTGEGDFIRAAK